MKSPNKQDWQQLAQLAAQYAGEMLEYSCGRLSAPKCIQHFSPEAASQWRRLREKTNEADDSGYFFQEARFIKINLASISDRNAVVASRGVLLRYGTRYKDNTDFAETSIFHLWLTCHCFPRPSGPQGNDSHDGKKTSDQFHSLPFQLQIMDFDYETIH
jgi:hypothetical protein